MGHGLNTFDKVLDRDERQMAVLGSRLLAEEKKVGETAEAMELRQTGENSILANLATSVSESITQMLRWVYWWNSSEVSPDDVTDQQVLFELNTDYNPKGMTALELVAVVKSWLQGGFGTEGVELARVPLDSDSVLINRRRYILHPRGVKFTSTSVAGDTPTNAELETGTNWVRVFENKNVRIVAIEHNN